MNNDSPVIHDASEDARKTTAFMVDPEWSFPQPRRAASIAAMSIFFIVIIASNARLATAGSGSVTALVRTMGVICQDNPHLSLHQPHALSSPPLPTIAFQYRSVSAWSA